MSPVQWIEGGVSEHTRPCINPVHAQLRIASGWYGNQQPGRLRMNPDLTVATLCSKAKCTVKDINRNGLYKFTHIATGHSYVGKAQRQSLKKRLLQHLNEAMSDRKLHGNFDPFLRQNPFMGDWMLIIWPMEQYRVAEAEKVAIRMLRPTLNVQQP